MIPLWRPGEDDHEDGWPASLLGPRAASVITTYAAPCLHFAHRSALWRHRLSDWTNETTYGTDRYHCFCEVFASVVEQRLPEAHVHRPTDRLGTPFTVETRGWLLYPFRYGATRSDPDEGFRYSEERGSGIRAELVADAPDDQGVFAYPDLPPLPRDRVIFLAWAGNRHEGLVRAFLGVPHLVDGRLYWRRGMRYELDVDAGRALYDGPGEMDGNGDGEVPPPVLDLELIDTAAGIDFDELFGTGTDDH